MSKPKLVRVQLSGRRYHQMFEIAGEVGREGDVVVLEGYIHPRGKGGGLHYASSMIAYDTVRREFVGRLDLYKTEVVGMRDTGGLNEETVCMEDLKDFKRAHKVKSDEAIVVGYSYIEEGSRGKGIGVALYVAAAAFAKRLDLALVADACTYEGQTSLAARRVWRSQSFRHYVHIGPASALVAVLKT